MNERMLVLETSGKAGLVGVALGDRLVGRRRLDEARRHARDLAPAVQELLAEQGWRPRDLQAVAVSRGPGSYTGLRVGIMSAKALAYATGCALVAVDTFAALAAQAPADTERLEVLADAQQGKLYRQVFERQVAGPLGIAEPAEWQAPRLAETWITGPGLRGVGPDLPPLCRAVPEALWDPTLESVLHLALERFRRGERDDLWQLEPLYARASSAEEKWQKK